MLQHIGIHPKCKKNTAIDLLFFVEDFTFRLLVKHIAAVKDLK